MAPQNSTLLHENAELAKELSHYSPITKAQFDEVYEYSSYTSSDVIDQRKSIPKFRKTFDEQVRILTALIDKSNN